MDVLPLWPLGPFGATDAWDTSTPLWPNIDIEDVCFEADGSSSPFASMSSSLSIGPDINGQAIETHPNVTGISFESDLQTLEDKKYRFWDHGRAFPPVDFYLNLLYNDDDYDRVKNLVARFHHFISGLAAEEADEAWNHLRAMQAQTEPLSSPDGSNMSELSATSSLRKVNDAYLRHARQRAGLAVEEDPSWPKDDGKKREYVKLLFDAITNTANFHEARKAKAKAASYNTASRGKAPSASERVLADDGKTAVDRLKAVLHYKMSKLGVELVSWKILQGHTMRALWAGERTNSQWDVYEKFEDRWRTIRENMFDCKMMLHSVTRADWVAKLAGAPMRERKNKLDNDIINARKGAQLKAGARKIQEGCQNGV
ncbi:hypothetical protein CSOJ01_15539 [Colletotrichum sojae]|uniref:Uncharacterized protein n=1 Tax=Colletotrichum sojae TaxID=2175907 RepID=A0A8H6IM26_9PEZI|nr:hypothetical protein CSOJ01_15539 [Colletotrichum sojae]